MLVGMYVLYDWAMVVSQEDHWYDWPICSIVIIAQLRALIRNRKLLISRAPTKAKSQEPAYSQALNQNKIDRQRSRSRDSGRQSDGAWSSDGKEVWGDDESG